MVSGVKYVIDPSELTKLFLLKGAEVESVRGLLEDCLVQELKADEVLIHAEQPNQFLYLLLSGHLRVHLDLTLDPIVVLEPGEVVGELSLIDGELTSAHVVAGSDCRILVLDEETMWSLLDASPVARNLLFILARRLRHGDSLLSTSQQLQREYELHATTDALTGLHNRRWLDKMLVRHMERGKRDDRVLSLLLIDVDNFKNYNDTHGHVGGDRVLYTVARALREGMRPGDQTARYGGDEFVALLPETDAPASRRVSQRLCKAVAEADVSTLSESPLPAATISVGVAQMTPADNCGGFASRGRQSLIQCKEAGSETEFPKPDAPPESLTISLKQFFATCCQLSAVT